MAICVLALLSGSLAAAPLDAGVDDRPSAARPDAGPDGPRSAAPAASVDHTPALPDPRIVARHIRALMTATLDPAIDARSLFVIDLTDPAAAGQLGVALTGPAQGSGAARDDGAAHELALARAAFLQLPAAQRATAFERHARAHATLLATRGAAAAKQLRIDELERQAAQLRALLAGAPAADVDPRSLLQIDLAADGEVAVETGRRRAFLARLQAGDPPAAVTIPNDVAEAHAGSVPPDDLDERLDRARRAVDDARARYLHLDAGARAALLAVRQTPSTLEAEPPPPPIDDKRVAEDAAQRALEAQTRAAAAQRARALDAARHAATESARQLEEARARLHELVERQATIEAELLRDDTALDAVHERALGWDRRVKELNAARNAPAAELAYDELVGGLTTQRDELDRALDDLNAPSQIPRSDGDASEAPLAGLFTAVELTARRLRALEIRVRWARAKSSRDAIVSMNRARLELLSVVSDERRSGLQGFGPEGRAQARRELHQIALEVRFRIKALPQVAAELAEQLRARPIETAKTTLLLLALLVAFRWWRSRAPRILTAMQVRPASRTAPSRLQRAMVPALWYLARARGPLEWLLLISLVDRLVPTAGGLPELQLVGFIVLWALLGTLAIRILDAVVARQAAREAVGDDTAWLRYRSLRAIASTIVCVGLVLSLTRASVGQAAIYAWVWRTCWLLAVPIVLVLLRWWRAPIFARLGARQDPRPIPRWVSAHERGLASFPATVIGAAWLLGGGVWRWLVSQASTLKATRRLLAYLFRRQVERHAAARDGDVTFSPLAPLPHAALDPELPSPIVASVMAERIDAMRALASEGRHRVIAVIGERGLGKTTFLRQVAAGLPAQDTCWIDGTPGGFDELVHGAALVLGATASDESALRAELTVRRPALIVLDDAHLLVRPMIGGLDDLDRVMQLAAQVGGRTTWILAISKYAWHFLRLARSDRAMFDRVVELERWSEEQLNELTRTRATAAHIAPRFDELVIPRQLDASPYETDERAERDYHRILWDYADGNPRMALHWWRESLFERDGNVFVRLFKAPPLDAGEPVPAGLRFVLRAIVQLDLAHERDLIACTNLGATDVNDALRAGLARGLIEPVGERHRIARGAFRAVILFLRRQHLLLP